MPVKPRGTRTPAFRNPKLTTRSAIFSLATLQIYKTLNTKIHFSELCPNFKLHPILPNLLTTLKRIIYFVKKSYTHNISPHPLPVAGFTTYYYFWS